MTIETLNRAKEISGEIESTSLQIELWKKAISPSGNSIMLIFSRPDGVAIGGNAKLDQETFRMLKEIVLDKLQKELDSLVAELAAL
jgi:hypothetical protein